MNFTQERYVIVGVKSWRKDWGQNQRLQGRKTRFIMGNEYIMGKKLTKRCQGETESGKQEYGIQG